MNMNKAIRNALGLGEPKASTNPLGTTDEAELAKLDATTGYVAQGEDGPHTPIEYVESRELGQKKVDIVPVPADGRATAQNVQTKPTATPTAGQMLAAAEERQVRAGNELKAFELTHGAKTLLERAMDNVGKNNGSNLEDPGAKAKAEAFATLTVASGYSLDIVIQVLAESEAPSRVAGTVFSYCYTVLKAACFIANLDYRRALDPKGELDLRLYVDSREEQRDAPPGLQADPQDVAPEDLVTQALSDLQLMLTLVAESAGWQPQDKDGEPSAKLLPLMVMMTVDGKFESIYDVEQALDRQELQRQVALAKRRDAMAKLAQTGASRAAELVRAALARKH